MDYPRRIGAEDRAAKLTFLINLAALYHNPRGNVGGLSKDLGLHRSTLKQALIRKKVSPAIAKKLLAILAEADIPSPLLEPLERSCDD